MNTKLAPKASVKHRRRNTLRVEGARGVIACVARAKIFDHAHLSFKTAPIFALTRQFGEAGKDFLLVE